MDTIALYTLSDEHFDKIRSMVYEYARINLTEKKRALVIARLTKRIKKNGMSGFKEYLDFIEQEEDGAEFTAMIDAISTNFTTFFRESHHFDFLEKTIFPEYSDGQKTLNIWSAASSSGQEIYSILMSLKEFEKTNNAKIKHYFYASDISRKVLRQASSGVYNLSDVKGMDPSIMKKYFLEGKNAQKGLVKIRSSLSNEIRFFRLNLMDEVYKLPQMDVIFLRNAIIYFDVETKKELIARLHNYIKPGGYLVLGHSESLSGISSRFTAVGRTIYKRIP